MPWVERELAARKGRVSLLAIRPPCPSDRTVSCLNRLADAIRTIAALAPQAAIYVEAAHGGWMGFEHNAEAFVQLMKGMDVLHLIRGARAQPKRCQLRTRWKPDGSACQ